MELFLLWVLVLVVLLMMSLAPVPTRTRIVAGIGMLLTLWMIWGIYGARWLYKFTAPEDVAVLGQWGDSFGSINALFAACAFGGVVVAALIQNKTFQLANKQHAQQAFEPLFFHLLEFHRQLAGALKLKLPDGMTQGNTPDVGGPLSKKIPEFRAIIVQSGWGSLVQLPTESKRVRLQDQYMPFYNTNQDELGPYFRSLYHIFKLIHNAAGLTSAQRNHYANIARALLSGDEVFLLAVNCALPIGETFRPLVEGYGLLKHWRREGVTSADEQIIGWFYRSAGLPEVERLALWKLHPEFRPSGF